MGNRSNDDRSKHFNPTWKHYRKADYNNPDHALYREDDDDNEYFEAPSTSYEGPSRFEQARQERENNKKYGFEVGAGDHADQAHVTISVDGEDWLCVIYEKPVDTAMAELEREFSGAEFTYLMPTCEIKFGSKQHDEYVALLKEVANSLR
ncbi:hypothetical protein AUP74_02149 [Microbulbifer aggregans]|uniref:Uncharacterized protein n=2 Tax=Microbulbifer aggregans TaxID=1769779 RepID=A0A1C9W8X6_9GAMM|nr:hypothetical protein AUP74_02149 [Microbulbifer aggregans]